MSEPKSEPRTVGIRMSDVVYKKAEENAKKLGFIKTTGEANMSEYIRYLIINDNR